MLARLRQARRRPAACSMNRAAGIYITGTEIGDEDPRIDSESTLREVVVASKQESCGTQDEMKLLMH